MIDGGNPEAPVVVQHAEVIIREAYARYRSQQRRWWTIATILILADMTISCLGFGYLAWTTANNLLRTGMAITIELTIMLCAYMARCCWSRRTTFK